jgi:hypothetical protein
MVLLTSLVLAGLAAHRETQRRLLAVRPLEWSYQDAKLTREVTEMALDMSMTEQPEPNMKIVRALARDLKQAQAQERANKATLDRIKAAMSSFPLW